MKIEKLEELLVQVTKRERTYLKIKALSVFLYFNGLSSRAISLVLKYLGYNVSYEAIRKWVHQLAKFIHKVYIKSNICYVDETKIKKKQKFYSLWLAVNEKGIPLFCWLSAKANKQVAKLVLLNTKSKKIVTDKAPWYPAACKELGLQWKHETFGKRNVIERAFMPIKKRMKSFLIDFQQTRNTKQCAD